MADFDAEECHNISADDKALTYIYDRVAVIELPYTPLYSYWFAGKVAATSESLFAPPNA